MAYAARRFLYYLARLAARFDSSLVKFDTTTRKMDEN